MTQNQQVLSKLKAGKEIDISMFPYITRLSARVFDIEGQGYRIDRGWRRLGKSLVRTYKLGK